MISAVAKMVLFLPPGVIDPAAVLSLWLSWLPAGTERAGGDQLEARLVHLLFVELLEEENRALLGAAATAAAGSPEAMPRLPEVLAAAARLLVAQGAIDARVGGAGAAAGAASADDQWADEEFSEDEEEEEESIMEPATRARLAALLSRLAASGRPQVAAAFGALPAPLQEALTRACSSA
jgi:hypothetical protein